MAARTGNAASASERQRIGKERETCVAGSGRFDQLQGLEPIEGLIQFLGDQRGQVSAALAAGVVPGLLQPGEAVAVLLATFGIDVQLGGFAGLAVDQPQAAVLGRGGVIAAQQLDDEQSGGAFAQAADRLDRLCRPKQVADQDAHAESTQFRAEEIVRLVQVAGAVELEPVPGRGGCDVMARRWNPSPESQTARVHWALAAAVASSAASLAVASGLTEPSRLIEREPSRIKSRWGVTSSRNSLIVNRSVRA
jgi:hypothetical protein